MIRIVCLTSTLLAAGSGLAQATPVSAISELSMSHSFVINGGASPAGIEVDSISETLVLSGDTSSSADGAGFTNSETGDTQVGNPFDDPPLPFEASETNATVNLGNGDVATANYDVSILVENDPAAGNSEFDPVRRATEQSGIAAAAIAADPVDAEAASSFTNVRDYSVTNTTDETISFNISGLFEAEMSASHDGPEGFARTSGSFQLLFDTEEGIDITYFPVGLYGVTEDETGPGATVTELFLANAGGITGVSFTGSTTAIADGSATEASLSAQSSYIFGITMEAGTTLLLQTGFSQANAVSVVAPGIPPVPLPASLPLLLAGLGGVALLRRG